MFTCGWQELRASTLSPSEAVYDALLHSFGQRQKWSRVTRLLERMKAKGIQPGVDAYGSLVWEP